MPTSSHEVESVEPPKKLDEGGETAGGKQNPEPSENGNASKDKEVKDENEKQEESPETIRENLVSEATTLLAQGKRHLFVRDYPSAVSALGDACSKFSELFGELADECADPYFNYGCALLELAREESGVIDVDNKEKESEESEEGEDETDPTGDVKKDATEKETEQKDAEADKNENEKDETLVEEKIAGEEDAIEEEEEEVNNLQLAWEMFELSKVIFTRQSDEKRLAETYLRLGEVALESENYGSAITDIQSCLDLQNKILPPVSREIAETYYQLGVACSLCNQFDDAIKHFTAAGVLLERRIQNLNKMSEPEPDKAKNPFYTVKNEIEEIKALLPEIKDKIADMEEFRNETMKAVVQATIGNTTKDSTDGAGPSTNGTTACSPSSSAASSNAPANDISHLVRKKRKNPEDASNIVPKKPCNESSTS